MSLVNTITGEVVETIGAAEARRLTTEAQNEFRSSRDHFDRAWSLIEQAVNGGGHVDLGYRSPSDYLHAEFDGALSGLDVPSRRTAVRTMTSWGLSTRAIAKPLGISQPTVSRIASGDSDESPAPHGAPQTAEPVSPPSRAVGAPDTGSAQASQGEDAPDPASESPTVEPASPRPAVVGIDGKSYTPPQPKAAPRKPLPDSFFRRLHDTRQGMESLHRLVGDDRWTQNAEKVAAAHRNDLLRIRDLLDQVINALPTEESNR